MSDPTNRPATDWQADLDIAEAQADIGDVVPGDVVLADLKASIDRMEAKKRKLADGKLARHS